MGTFGSLFSGVGGIDLGLERAGWECRWQEDDQSIAFNVVCLLRAAPDTDDNGGT